MGDKPNRYLPSLQEMTPPKEMKMAESFAFVSPLPLDECARRMVAKNTVSVLWGKLGNAKILTRLHNDGMNDQTFTILRKDRFVPVWSVGALRDIDGETTWVTGTIGVQSGSVPATMLIVGLMVSPFVIFSGFDTGCLGMLALYFVGILCTIPMIRYPMRLLMRRIFGLEGDGPLPVEEQPQEAEVSR